MKPILIIPSFNEEDTIYLLTQKLIKYDIPILIVDDGSSIKIQNNILPNNVLLIRNNTNTGKGYSLQKAFSYSKDKLNVSHAIVIDADFQHDPKFVKHFLEADSSLDIVCGVRTFDSTMPIHRRLSNFITSKIISILTKVTISDSQCGYRRYNIQKFNKITCHEKGFQFESEFLIKALRNKWSYKELPISTIYNNNKSKIRNMSDTVKFIYLIIRNLKW